MASLSIQKIYHIFFRPVPQYTCSKPLHQSLSWRRCSLQHTVFITIILRFFLSSPIITLMIWMGLILAFPINNKWGRHCSLSGQRQQATFIIAIVITFNIKWWPVPLLWSCFFSLGQVGMTWFLQQKCAYVMIFKTQRRVCCDIDKSAHMLWFSRHKCEYVVIFAIISVGWWFLLQTSVVSKLTHLHNL